MDDTVVRSPGDGRRATRPASQSAAAQLRSIALPAFGPSLIASLGQGAVLPVVALRARDLGASVGGAAFLVALISVGTLAAALPSGSLVARIGERPALVVAAALDAAAMGIGWLATSLWELGASLVLMGLAAAVFNLARQAYLTDAVPRGMRARALSTLGGVTRIGLFVGPFAGAAAIHVWGLPAAYAVGLAAAVATGALLLATRDLAASPAAPWAGSPDAIGRRDTAEAGEPPQVPVRERVVDVLRAHRHTFLTIGTGVVAISAARAVRVSIIPLWADHVGLPATTTALLFGVAGAVDMLLFYPAGSVMDRYGRAWVAVPSVAVLGLGMLVLPLSRGVAGVGLVAVVLAVGNGIGSGLVMTLGADAAPAVARAQFLGGWRLFAELGGLAGPLVISAVATVGTLALASLTMGFLSLLGAAWIGRWVPWHRVD